MNTITMNPRIASAQTWSAVGSMALCVAMLIASEFMPVSLLTPIAADLGATQGMAGAVANLVWQWISLPAMPPQAANPVGKVVELLKRRHVAVAMVGIMLTFAGAFSTFTYLRPFLEMYTRVSVPQLSLLLLGLGLAGFAGTYCATALLGRHLYRLIAGLPLALGAVTLALLAVGHRLWAVAPVMIAWGALNSAIPVAWSAWLTKGIGDEPESGGGLMVGAIQLSIMLGAAFGGLLLDHLSIAATLIGGTVLLVLASLTVGNGDRIKARMQVEGTSNLSTSNPRVPEGDFEAYEQRC